ncbi:hypothetical protein [Chamaesiphon polymorphus]|uniref:Uncharacterized protein n=1 Tax=Chamaesiphon polymorphus CCALA 037 TaxID=2107692 RepID=A0A2T1GC18_9CYAN|nr:hypothetical protein [Chamaesiphon polymorphus]PSB54919.1 hypothetical protein C7B77_16645 [Chamaesiphon polymorphus CCALA 037]
MSNVKNTAIGLATITILSLSTASSSFAAECKGDRGFAKQFITELKTKCAAEGAADLKQCKRLNKIAPIVEGAKKLLAGLGVSIGNDWMKLGAVESGNIVNPANPRFTTDLPVESDSISVKLDKLVGKAGADAAICAFDDKGGVTKLGEIKISADKETDTKSVNVSGASGKILQVQLDGNGGALRRMKFNLLAQ